jgi:enoyl-CoA hydratase/carnithine racemase
MSYWNSDGSRAAMCGNAALCAGRLAAELEVDADLLLALAGKVSSDLLETIRRAPLPTACAINGYCLGGAMELAMVCDVRVASENAMFGMPEIKVGIPSVLDAALLHQHVGLSKAKEMLLTGDLYGAGEMERYGLLNKVVQPGRLEDETALMLDRLTGHSRTALAAQKRLFETWHGGNLYSWLARLHDKRTIALKFIA